MQRRFAATNPGWAPAFALVLGMLGLPQPAAARPEDALTLHHSQGPDGRGAAQAKGGPQYTVARGDTLGAIALRLGVTIDQLCSWNPGLHPDRIREGQRLAVGPEGRAVEHEIVEGETLSYIARRYEVSVEDLLRWNPGLQRDVIRAGRTLQAYTQVPISASQSVGTPHRGRLVDGVPLPAHPGYVIRERERAFGTAETVHNLVSAIDAVRDRFRRTPKVRVHDVSLIDGGPMQHHRSHQSGRDVDLSYFQQTCKRGVCAFAPVGPGTIDAKRTWALLSHWLRDEQLEAVFIDYKLQRVLYREAKRRGASGQELSRWFQYPRGRTHPSGVVRHFPKHHDHMHVRFACHGSDPECKTLRPLITGVAHAGLH